MSDPVNELNESVTALSEVTPRKKNNPFLNFKVWGLVGICIAFVGFACLPKAEKKTVSPETTSLEQKELTLSQNLELLERKKRQEQLSTLSAQQAEIENRPPIKPPKLRHRQALSKEILARMNAPTTFFTAAAPSERTAATQSVSASAALAGTNQDSQFLNQQNEVTSVSAKRMSHPADTVPAGEMIEATLETSINPELPGLVRAVVARNVYALQGGKCLIPKGSVLFGPFNPQIVEGQRRILVLWSQVRLANGVIVNLNSPATDALGRAGIGADYVNRHFFERFGTSALLSVLGGYAATNGVNGQDRYNSLSQYRMTMASSFQQASSQTLQGSADIKDSLQTNQGDKINVFVAHDLDFYGVNHG